MLAELPAGLPCSMLVRSEAFWTPVLRSDLHRLSFLLLLVSLLGWLSGNLLIIFTVNHVVDFSAM